MPLIQVSRSRLRDRLIQVQQRVGDHGPGRAFGGRVGGGRPIEAARDVGGWRVTHRRKANVARACGVRAASLSTRRASARAASKYASSLSSASAWSGVFVRTRRTVQDSRLVASRVRKLGYGDVRRMKV